MNIYWNGPRESDYWYTGNIIKGSVTFFGSDKNGNRSYCGTHSVRIDHNVDSQDTSDFILESEEELIRNDPGCRIMYYNPNYAYDSPAEIDSRIICRNDHELMKTLNNKLSFREMAENTVPMLPMKLLKGADCTYNRLKAIPAFSHFNEFVIQELSASGGHGTFLMYKNDRNHTAGQLKEKEDYIVTGYIKRNVSVNIHAVIFDKTILLFPASIQIIQYLNGRLLYRGGDFEAYRQIDAEIHRKFVAEVEKLLQLIQSKGYRGVIGVDGLIDGESVYVVEVNNRFQGSSILVNRALSERNLPSLQELTIEAFSHREPEPALQEKIRELSSLGSFYNFINESNGVHARYMHSVAGREPHVKEIVNDGYSELQQMESDAYLFSIIFDSNIVSLCDRSRAVRIHPNIAAPSQEMDSKIREGNLTAIKTSLLNRGARMTSAAVRYVERHGKMRVGTYLSLDVYTKGCYLNCPLYIRFTSLSPFVIDYTESDGMILRYYSKKLFDVDYDIQIDLPAHVKMQQPQIDRILFLATDRLRIQNNNYCTFAEHGVPCKFCEAKGIHNNFTEADILRAVDYAFHSNIRPLFRHVLIGGLSNDVGKERQVFLDICRAVRKYSSDIPIYLMSLPPKPEDVDQYIDAGVTEVGFNLEIYDRELAKKLMPGKSMFSLQKYYSALDEAVKRLGRTGAVRTAFIVGLEPKESLLEGIEDMASRGVAPILSVFRPIPGTDLADVIPPSDDWIYDLLVQAEAICRKYNLTLGPQCPACRNNTLSFACENEMDVLYESGWSRDVTQRRLKRIG